MPTPAERQALLFVAAVAALGLAARGCQRLGTPEPAPPERAALAAQLGRVDSLLATGGAGRRGRSREAADSAPPAGRSRRARGGASVRAQPGADTAVGAPLPPVDVDVAGVAELDRLPGIGPALAARIVADREARGPFGSLEGLVRVRGIGPALAERLRAHVTFSLSPRPLDTGVPAAGRRADVRHP